MSICHHHHPLTLTYTQTYHGVPDMHLLLADALHSSGKWAAAVAAVDAAIQVRVCAFVRMMGHSNILASFDKQAKFWFLKHERCFSCVFKKKNKVCSKFSVAPFTFPIFHIHQCPF